MLSDELKEILDSLSDEEKETIGARYKILRAEYIELQKAQGKECMKAPPHPGRLVRQECIEPLGLTIVDASKALGVKRQTLSNLVNEKAGISPEMAIRLEMAFGGKADTWLRMQADYDLSQARGNADKIHVERFIHA